jgi:2-isopropylmalate synthase
VQPAERELRYSFAGLEAISRTGSKPHANIELVIDGETQQASADGDGPVDAAFKAVEMLVSSGANLLLYSVNAITSGTDSQGEVQVRLEKNGTIANGNGADTDIIVASVKAYLDALNLLDAGVLKAHPQRGV